MPTRGIHRLPRARRQSDGGGGGRTVPPHQALGWISNGDHTVLSKGGWDQARRCGHRRRES